MRSPSYSGESHGSEWEGGFETLYLGTNADDGDMVSVENAEAALGLWVAV